MKKIVLATAATLMVAMSMTGIAEAQRGGGGGKGEAPSRPLPPRPEFTTGIVSSYVPESRTLKFNTGGEYRLAPAAVAGTTIHAGDKVQLRWLMKGGIRMADEVTIRHAAPPAADKASTEKPAETTPAPASPS